MGLLDHVPPRPAFGRVTAALAILLFVRAFLIAAYNSLGDAQRELAGTWTWRLVDELSAAATGLPVMIVGGLLALRWPLRSARWRRHLLILAGVFVVYSASHTISMELLRWLVYPAMEMARNISSSALWLAIGHEMPNDLFYFALVVSATELWRFWWDATDRERREGELRRSLAEAQLTALRLQLQPHFLFNALNTVSATMYDDPRSADAMLGELSELLRASLKANRSDQVPLAEEVGIAERYVRLQQARFGERLSVTFDVPPDCRHLLVPVFVLQPLIENAVRHGNVERLGRGSVHVTARRDGAVLTIGVLDDGGGHDSIEAGNGIGLRATSERLRLLYGARSHFAAGPTDGGWRVSMTLPASEPAV